MLDQRGDLGRALVAEVGKVGRQIEPAIVGHQVLDAVEIAAEGEVVDALLAAAALPVQVDGDDRRAFGRADRVVPISPAADLSFRSCWTLRTPSET